MTVFVPALRHVDDALDDRTYGPTSSHSELSLLTGYGAPPPPVVVERAVMAQACVCGGPWIDPGVASEIPAAVYEHNSTEQHLRWRERAGIR